MSVERPDTGSSQNPPPQEQPRQPPAGAPAPTARQPPEGAGQAARQPGPAVPARTQRTEPLPTPTENANRIAGLQAWMADIDRRLGIRTKLILVLAALAIGGAGAAIYLAVEANRTSADQEQLNELEAQVERLEGELEAVAEAGGADPDGALDPGVPDSDPGAGAIDPDEPTGDADDAAGAGQAGDGDADADREPVSPTGGEDPAGGEIDPDAGPPIPDIGTDGE